MKTTVSLAMAAASTLFAVSAAANTDYNRPPASDGQYRQCLSFAMKRYTGGSDPSPIAGQTKVQAWCTCLWNETPEDFKGNLVTFSESPRGAKTNSLCEKHANWSD